jgi:hypothetical protein
MIGWLKNAEQLLEWEQEGETEVSGETLSQRNIVHQKSYMTWPGIEAGCFVEFLKQTMITSLNSLNLLFPRL